MTEQFEKIFAALEKNNMKPYFAETKEDAKKIVESLLTKGCSVSHGGSESIKECGIIELLGNGDYEYIDRSTDAEAMRKAFFADVYFTSANALTEDGFLYNVDGNSNRIAAIAYGPKEVICIAGKNKIVKDLQEAKDRVRSVAAPKNAARLNCKTYCAEKGHCVIEDGSDCGEGCGSEGRICCSFLVSGWQRCKNRIKVILVNEDLGY